MPPERAEWGMWERFKQGGIPVMVSGVPSENLGREGMVAAAVAVPAMLVLQSVMSYVPALVLVLSVVILVQVVRGLLRRPRA